MFPVEEVKKITGVGGDGGQPHTYCRWDGGSLSDLQKLVEIGAADPNEAQNYSPTIKEILEELADYSYKVLLIGYVILPPRSDARVSVEGFEITGLTADEALHLMEKYGRADESSSQKDGEVYSVRFWWD